MARVKNFSPKPVFDKNQEATFNKKISNEFSKTLESISEVDIQFNSNIELLKKLRYVLLENLRVCDGAYKAKPTQGNIYALTNLVNQIQTITDRLEEAIDYNEIAEKVTNEVINPFMERIILVLGNIISSEISSCSESDKKTFKRVINSIFKKYGAEVEKLLPELNIDIVKNIINNVK